MSVHAAVTRLTVPKLRSAKSGTPLVALTAYTAPMAARLDPYADILLVGDSLGQVVHGFATTLPVPLDLMILHAQAVMRTSRRALVVVDMPFGTYEESPEVAFRNAARVLKETGAQAVKLEGGLAMAATIRFLAGRGIPVMAHVGLLPQAVHVAGGYRTKGRRKAEWEPVLADAAAVAEAGAFCVVLEGVAEPLAVEITARVAIPTIGIGASAACDGQILVIDDLIGFTPASPAFVRRYAEVGRSVDEAVAAYAADVRARRFPGPAHVYAMKE